MVKKDKHKMMAIGLAILLSIMLWIYVMGEKNPVQTRVIDNVKVSIENKDYITKSNLVLVPDQVYTVSIAVTGRLNDIISVRSDDIMLEADMTRYLKKGDNDIPVSVKSLPSGITVNKLDIPNVKVKLDNLSTKFIPIEIVVNGNSKDGYEYINPVSEPKGVMISGPKSYVDDVDKVIAKISLNNVNKKVTKTVPVEPVGSDNRLITNISLEPKFAEVTVDVSPSIEVPIVVKTTGMVSDDLILENITSKVNNIKVVGDKKSLEKIKAIETESFDISGIKETIIKEVGLILPEGVSTKSDIKSVGVEVKVNKKIQKEFNVKLNMEGKKEGFEYISSSNEVNVKVSASEDVLNKISPEDIIAFVEVGDLKIGETISQVKVNIKGSSVVSGISPDEVKVNVKSTKSE